MGSDKTLSRFLPHPVLIAISATILLPLLRLFRVALTDKLMAYKISPEWADPSLATFVEISSVSLVAKPRL